MKSYVLSITDTSPKRLDIQKFRSEIIIKPLQIHLYFFLFIKALEDYILPMRSSHYSDFKLQI